MKKYNKKNQGICVIAVAILGVFSASFCLFSAFAIHSAVQYNAIMNPHKSGL